MTIADGFELFVVLRCEYNSVIGCVFKVQKNAAGKIVMGGGWFIEI